MKTTLSQVGELGLIENIRKAAFVTSKVKTGIGDDTAVLDPGGREYLLFTTDTLCEGVHFTRAMDPLLVGRKLLACNISDIAAMGGHPTFAVISFAAPSGITADYAKKVFQGINRLARQYQVSIVGGDTVACGKIVLNLSLLGKVARDKVVLRSGACVGDDIYVSGPLGGSLASGKHLRFVPRLKEAQYLVRNFQPTAMIDISDGLASDLRQILRQSKKGALLEQENIPLARKAALQQALTDGEDFELLFTLSKQQSARLMKSKGLFSFTRIGQIKPKAFGLKMKAPQGKISNIHPAGFQHFAK